MNCSIKICGFKDSSLLEKNEFNGLKWIGLIFYKNSPRYISMSKASNILKIISPKLIPVAVIVDKSIEEVKEFKSIGISTIQLHGTESPEYCELLFKKYKFNLIKAISVKKEEDITLSYKYKNYCEYILFDAKGNNESMPGGNGVSFNWNLLKDKNFDFKWILSGGLNTRNVSKALKITKAKYIDVSSGVEDDLGNKNKYLIRKFCNNALC